MLAKCCDLTVQLLTEEASSFYNIIYSLPESGQEEGRVSKQAEAGFKSSEHHFGGKTGLI